MVKGEQDDLLLRLQGFHQIHKGLHALDGLVVDLQDDIAHLETGFPQGTLRIFPGDGNALVFLQTVFFGLFGIMEKFSAVIGPMLFAIAGVVFGSSRPAVLSLIVIFFVGGLLLTFVKVEEGKRVAQSEDAILLQGISET